MVIKLQQFIDVPTNETIINTIRDNFYNLRKSKKLSREKLSKISGVNVGVIRRFEENKYISLENLISLAIALNVSDDLMNIFKPIHEVKLYE